jgi:hypothetical protein
VDDADVLVKVKDRTLRRSEIKQQIPRGLSSADSMLLAESLERKWVKDALVYDVALRNLEGEDKAEVDKLVEEYRHSLKHRMKLLGITPEDVVNPNYTGQNMSFGEALQALEAGKGWITTCFVVKQIDSDIPAEVVPKMQSLPQHAKNLLNAFGVGSISYRSQCLLVEQAGDGNGATNYVPDWVDMFAKDWFVLGGE